MYTDPLGLKYVPLRKIVEDAGGTVSWSNGVASIGINGLTTQYYVGDAYGTSISGGTMYVDDLNLNGYIYAPIGVAMSYYNNVSDDFGKYILRTWLTGHGDEVNVNDARWSQFIFDNEHVKSKLAWLIEDTVQNGINTFDVTSALALTNYGGGYSSGYELINGSNEDVGGFNMKGTIAADEANGGYWLHVDFQFNDIIDMNPIYRNDTILAGAAKITGYNCKDYILRIMGNGNFFFSYEGGLIRVD